MTVTSFNLHQHIALEHKLSPLSKYLKEIVYGGSDGIVTTFAVVAGFAGAGSNPVAEIPVLAVLLFGFANLFADGASMALGNLLSTRSAQDVYAKEKKKELQEIHTNPVKEREESEAILVHKGFTDAQARQLTDIYTTNESYWLEFMMNDELEMANPEGDNPTIMAVMTCASFILFGLIPLLPYLFFRDDEQVFFYSVLTACGSLILLGLLRWRITTHPVFRTVGETLLLGGAAALVAYLVGTFFRI